MSVHQKLSYTSSGDETLSLQVYNVGYEQCQSLHKWGPGVRNFYLIHHIVKGKGTYKVGKKTFEIGEGSTFIIYPGAEITYQADKQDPWDYYWVGFTGNDARILLEQTDFTKEKPVLSVDLTNQFEKLLMDIYQSKGSDDASKVKMSGYLLLALSLLVEKASSKVHKDSSNQYIQKALEYIEFNYSQKLTVQDIADEIGISRSQLYRVFMDTYQKSPMQFILEYRIRIACQLLKTRQLSIGSIGYSVGFYDNLYFSKAFKKIKGMSPSEYIRTLKTTVVPDNK